MENQWQPKTRGGWPVENVRLYDGGEYVWQGVVEFHNADRMHFTWTQDGRNIPGQTTNYDLIPLEAPADPPLDPAKVQAHNRLVLALAATQYKRACDATEAAEDALMLAHNALAVALKAYGVQAVVVSIDGAAFLFEDQDQFLSYAKIEVL